jgi:hypothetical protein
MEPLTEEKLEQLERVLQSRAMQGSESLKSFLRFVVLKTIENREVHLKEYTIATEVFGRDSSYDSRSDSVVRVQAGRLRFKLQEYYRTEGKGDRVLIDLPKGHYTPVFSYAQPTDGWQPPAPSAAQRGPALTTRPANAHWLKLSSAALAVVALILGLLAVNNRLEINRLKSSSASRAGQLSVTEESAPLWGDLLRSPEQILVVFSNAQFEGTAESGMRLLRPLDSSLPSSHAPDSAAAADAAKKKAQVITEHYTGVGEVMGVYFLSDFFAKVGHPFWVKRSLLLNWDDLKTENIVVLGSPAENYLIRDLPQQQDFVFRTLRDDNQTVAFGLVNTNPQPNEQKIYLAKQEGPSRSQISEDYALISLLRGLDANHKLLILAGVTTYGTQAAAEYVTKPEYIRELIAHLNTSPAGATPKLPAFYQIVIKVKVNGEVPVQTTYVTHHVL